MEFYEIDQDAKINSDSKDLGLDVIGKRVGIDEFARNRRKDVFRSFVRSRMLISILRLCYAELQRVG